MNEQWKRKEYDTWDEAFRALTPAVRQQSVRVAAYSQTLFVQACADSFGAKAPGGADRMRGPYADLAYKCGMYHQLGKALVPPEYQILQPDFTDEENAVYRKYTSDGRLLVATLQERSTRAKEKRTGEIIEQPTENIPWLMIRESCEQHMERWDGSGYPAGRKENQISTIAQIVGLAKELDRLSAETKSETPFEDAYETLTAQAGTLWSPELIEVLKKAKTKCRVVYNKYIRYTMTLPKTIPLVQKRAERPMGLRYRPMICDNEGTVAAYEAVAWFGGIADRPGEVESAEELEPMLVRTNLMADVSFYLLYEAADAVLRMNNCKLELQGILVQMMPGFYKLPTQLQRFNQLFMDQPIPKEQLMLTVPMEVVKGGSKAALEILGRYIRSGIALVLDGYDSEALDLEQVAELGFRHVRFAPELYLKQQTANNIYKLMQKGIRVIGGNADSHDQLGWMVASGISFMSGTLSGVLVSEDEMIRDCLLREK